MRHPATVPLLPSHHVESGDAAILPKKATSAEITADNFRDAAQARGLQTQVLGRGSFGVVYVVTTPQTQHYAACHYVVKLPLADATDLLEREKEAYARIGSHPYFLEPIQDKYLPAQLAFLKKQNLLIFPYYRAKDLFDLDCDFTEALPTSPSFEVINAQYQFYKNLLAQLVVAIQHLQHGSVALNHCDLKLENLLVVEDAATGKSQLKVLDLGFAIIRQTQGSFKGTPDYYPPEYTAAKKAGKKRYCYDGVDVWCFMLIAYFLFVKGYKQTSKNCFAICSFKTTNNPATISQIRRDTTRFRNMRSGATCFFALAQTEKDAISDLIDSCAQEVDSRPSINEIQKASFFASVDWAAIKPSAAQPTMSRI